MIWTILHVTGFYKIVMFNPAFMDYETDMYAYVQGTIPTELVYIPNADPIYVGGHWTVSEVMQ